MSIESVQKLQEVQKFVFCTYNPPPFEKKPQQKGKNISQKWIFGIRSK